LIKAIRWLFFLTVFLSLLTLVKEVPPFRIYLLDFALIPLATMTLLLYSSGSSRLRFTWQRIDTLFVCLLVAVSAAFAFSEDVARSVVTYIDWWLIVIVYFVARSLIPQLVNERMLQKYFWYFAIFLLAIGLIQFATGTRFGLIGNYFGAGFDQGVDATVSGVGTRGRVSGTTSNPIIFAMWVTAFSVLAASALNARQQHMKFMVLVFAAGIVVVSTLSRGAIAAYALSICLLVFLNREEMVRNVTIGVLLLCLLLPVGYLGMQQTSLDDTLQILEARIERQQLLEEDSGRVRVFKMGMELVAEPKVFAVGTGPDNMVKAYNKYVMPFQSSTISQYRLQRSGVHNVWMKTFVEYGVVAAFLLVFIWVDVMKRSLRLWRQRRQNPTAKVWGGYLLAFLWPFLLIDCSVYESAMAYHIMIMMAVIIGFTVSMTEFSRVRVRREDRDVGIPRSA
jgi:O-antigen ligase